MSKYLDTLYDLAEIVGEELEVVDDKIHDANGEMSSSDVDVIDKLSHIYKSLQTSIAMIEADSRHHGRKRGRSDDFMSEIEELIEKAPDERTRRKFERFISEMK